MTVGEDSSRVVALNTNPLRAEGVNPVIRYRGICQTDQGLVVFVLQHSIVQSPSDGGIKSRFLLNRTHSCVSPMSE